MWWLTRNLFLLGIIKEKEVISIDVDVDDEEDDDDHGENVSASGSGDDSVSWYGIWCGAIGFQGFQNQFNLT